MINYRAANTRGYLNPGWIQSRRTFSNNSYWNPRYMNWGVLEVINDDILQPGHTVPKHEHKNMEILGYIVNGPCHHWDSLGNKCLAESGSVQRMSSGSSIWHTESNQTDQPIRYLQLWIRPSVTNTPAEYTQQHFSREQKLNTFCLIASKVGPIVIKQQAQVWAGIFTEDYVQRLDPQRRYYLYLVLGSATVNDIDINEGDGIAIEKSDGISVTKSNNAEILLFEV
jgi:redox-sensitive bicupin YhaK (pirin superfamily)